MHISINITSNHLYLYWAKHEFLLMSLNSNSVPLLFFCSFFFFFFLKCPFLSLWEVFILDPELCLKVYFTKCIHFKCTIWVLTNVHSCITTTTMKIQNISINPEHIFMSFLFIYFIYGCVGSSFLCQGFLQLWQAGATLHRGARASHYRGLSCCGAQAPDAQAQ